MNVVLALLRLQYPDREFPHDLPSQQPHLAVIGDVKRQLGILKKWGGREGWISLEEGVCGGMRFKP